MALVLLLSTAVSAQDQPIEKASLMDDVPIRVRLQFLVLPNSKTKKLLVTPEHVKEVVAHTNDIYRSWNMQFDYDPATDFKGFPDAAAFNHNPGEITTPNGTKLDSTALSLTREAHRHPGKGIIWVVTTGGGGYSNSDSDYVYFRFSPRTELMGDAGFLAHETGHFFGLWHTFDGGGNIDDYINDLKKDPAKNAELLKPEALREKFRQKLSAQYARNPNVNPLVALNSHMDAPFDPGATTWPMLFPDDPYKPGLKLELTLDAPKDTAFKPLKVTIAPDLSNMMSYYGGGHTMRANATPRQRAKIREITLRGTRGHLLHTGIVNWENGQAYFFKGDRYIRYDLRANHAGNGYPMLITDTWEQPFRWNIDAGFVDGGRAWFFSGDSYVEFDVKKDALDNACLVGGFPPQMALHWKGWPAGWKDRKVDAAANWHDGKAILFSGAECARFDLKTKTFEPGYPKKISEEFPGLPFTDYLDGLIVRNPDQVEFFCGNQCCTYSPKQQRLTEDMRDIRGAWPRFPEHLRGAVMLSHTQCWLCQPDKTCLFNPLRMEVRATDEWKPITSHWHIHFEQLTGCANWADHQAIFFKDDQAQFYDLGSGKSLGPPQKFSQIFQRWPADWEKSGAHAAVLWNDGTAHFFKGTQFLTVDVAKKTVTQAPKPIAGNWKGWPASWNRRIDAIIPFWGDGEKGVICFFCGGEYVRFNVATGTVEGPPRKINDGQWPGLVWE